MHSRLKAKERARGRVAGVRGSGQRILGVLACSVSHVQLGRNRAN